MEYLARKALKYDTGANEYGGIYGGYQLDYRPVNNLTLSILELNSFWDVNGSPDYRDFNVNLGRSFLYNYTLPIGKFSINSSGTYNLTNQKWVAHVESINYNTCCWSLGWVGMM